MLYIHGYIYFYLNIICFTIFFTIFKKFTKKIIDDSKVTVHHAIIPTNIIGKSLTEDEEKN